jgi:UDP:flavonoid glycosyltransferase YjiC (YdhE family)
MAGLDPRSAVPAPFVSDIPDTYDDLLVHAADADLLLSTELVHPARLIAGVNDVPWILCRSTLSASQEEPGANLKVLKQMASGLAALCRAREIRRELLSRKPDLTLGLYSPRLLSGGADRRDTTVVGFAQYDDAADSLPDELSEFCRSGAPPLVFTLGSSVQAAQHVLDTAIAAARSLGLRIVLVVGETERGTHIRIPSDGTVFVAGYVNYARLFRHAQVVIHHAGIGTVTRALRAGVPMMVVPFVADQHRNAELVRRLGVGRVTAVEDYTPEHLVAELRMLLQDGSYRDRAEQLADMMRDEDGAAAACDAIERRFGPALA